MYSKTLRDIRIFSSLIRRGVYVSTFSFTSSKLCNFLSSEDVRESV